MTGLSRLSLNQRTTATWTLQQAIEGCLAAGLTSIGVWREQLAEAGLANAVRWIADAGLRVSTLCRGGFFTASDPSAIEEAHTENLRALDEAAALGAVTLCLVPGGLPVGDRDLPGARRRAGEAIDRLVPYARDIGVPLGIEPMNPIYAADRGVVSTLGQALDLAEPYASSEVGVVLDTFHVWWDPDLETQIARAGDRIHSYQVCDWVTPLPPDALLARGMMGDGHIDFATIGGWVRDAGYTGDIEVEIFNADIWATPGHEVLATMSARYLDLIQPYA